MGFISEFKEFAIKGNVIDLAVAVVLGAAFGRVVSGVTDSIITPIIALVVGKVNVADIKLTIVNTIFPIGILLQAVIDFVIIALVLFLIIKGMNTMNRRKEAAAFLPQTPRYTVTEQLLMDIKESLNKDSSVKKTDAEV
ncbi:MAG: large conductance mechanosensitive channel protein MscL [Segetibacter sp.]